MTVTDINEYRARKTNDVNEAALIVHFSDWSDTRIKTRYAFLQFVEAGIVDTSGLIKGDPTSGAMNNVSFPNGYDPVNHPEDNIGAVYAEGIRRGVFVVSE